MSPGQNPIDAVRRRGCANRFLLGLRLQKTGALTLHPGQAGGFPSSDPPSMAVGVERPLETIRHISASSIAGARHGFRCHATSSPGSADEEKLSVFIGARRIERLGHPLRKARIDFAFRRRLPLNRQNSFAHLQCGRLPSTALSSSTRADRAGNMLHSGLLTEQPRRQQNNASTRWTIIQKESRNTLRSDDGARDEILYKTWCRLALVRRQLAKPVDKQNRNP
jgi:hypothetical protein